jgi:hypothetical protein
MLTVCRRSVLGEGTMYGKLFGATVVIQQRPGAQKTGYTTGSQSLGSPAPPITAGKRKVQFCTL